MISWSPVLVQTVMTIAVLVGVGLAVIGQVRWRAVQEWEALADAREKRNTLLEQEIQMLRTAAIAQEGQVSELQRFNLQLQQKVDRLEKVSRERDG